MNIQLQAMEAAWDMGHSTEGSYVKASWEEAPFPQDCSSPWCCDFRSEMPLFFVLSKASVVSGKGPQRQLLTPRDVALMSSRRINGSSQLDSRMLS